MRATRGRFRHLLTVEQPAVTTSDMGGVKDAWTKYTTIYAAKTQYQAPTERTGTGRDVAKQVVRWETNYREDLDETMMLVDGTKRYNIKGFSDPMGQKRIMIIRAELLVEGDFN